MILPSSLVDILECCYAAFAAVPVPERLDVSPYKDADVARRVLARPLRELSDEDIGNYAASATLTILGDDDYRHFIPRILQLSITNTGWLGADPPIIANRLERTGWKNWTDDQQSVVRLFFGAAYEWSIDAGAETSADAELWLCGNLLIDRPLKGMLAAWRSSRTPYAAWRLADFHHDWTDADNRGERLPFWEEITDDTWQAVGLWLFDPATERQLRMALPIIDDLDRWKLERELTTVSRRSLH